MRGKNLVQLIKTLSLLSRPQGATKKQISDSLAISIRSVSRSIQMIEELGIPIYDERIPSARQKYWKIEPTYLERLPNISLPKITLNFPEIISLCMLAGESVIFRGTELDGHIKSAISKLMYFVPEKTRNELLDMKRIFICKTIGSKNYAGKENIIRKLTESMLNRTSCRITYHAFYKDKIEAEEIGPLHFFENKGGLYLFALKLKTRKVRTYAVERIRSIRSLNGNVNYPESFNPQAILNSAFDLIHGEPVAVKIFFSPSEARYIREKVWSENQHIQENPDGSLILSMETSGKRDVKRWVMSFGKEARLLRPADMRDEIQEELEEILADMKKNISNRTTFVPDEV
jgi:predicted DNA-binding transcriptional regulator YafY